MYVLCTMCMYVRMYVVCVCMYDMNGWMHVCMDECMYMYTDTLGFSDDMYALCEHLHEPHEVFR